MHDCWGSCQYQTFSNATHACCCQTCIRRSASFWRRGRPAHRTSWYRNSPGAPTGSRKSESGANGPLPSRKAEGAERRCASDLHRLQGSFFQQRSERFFCMSKLKMQTAGSFRSTDGGSDFCSIFSIIDTVRKNGGNPFQLFNNSFSLAFLD